MRGQWGYDAECSCGEWATNTGGAVRSYIEREAWYHKWSALADLDARTTYVTTEAPTMTGRRGRSNGE